MQKDQSKLIITVTANPSWIYPETRNHPVTPEEIADCVHDCYKAGASIAHLHAPKTWKETAKRIRDKCGIILQFGLSGEPLERRRELFQLKPDMMSIILTHHDEQFTKEQFNILHLKSEIEEYCRLCVSYGVKPEFEVWHLGAIWNLMHLQRNDLVAKPYFLSIFFGWPGGSWSPPTPDELMHRVRHLPPDSLYTTSVMDDKAQKKLLMLTIAMGGHVRVGTEDNPYLRSDVLAKDNVELVAHTAELSKAIGRDVATSEEAREIIRLGHMK